MLTCLNNAAELFNSFIVLNRAIYIDLHKKKQEKYLQMFPRELLVGRHIRNTAE